VPTPLRLLHVAPLPPPWTGIGVSVQHALASAPLHAQANWVISTSRAPGAPSSSRPKKPTPERMLRHVRLAARVGRVVRSRRVDVVHLHGSSHDFSLFGNWLSIVAARRAGARTVWHLHEDLQAVAFPGYSALSRESFAALMAAPDAVAVLTAKDKHVASTLVAPHRLTVIPPTCSPELLSLGIERPSSPIHVLFVGWLTPAKGIDDLLRVAAAVRTTPDRLVFDVVGTARTAADQEALRQRVKDEGLEGLVRLHGVKTGDEKVAFFARANLLFLPTHWDAFPVTILEAMSAGLPVLGTDVGGLPIMLERDRGAVLTAVGDVDAMASALLRLAGDANLRQAMGAANRDRFLDHYQPARVGGLMLDLYRRLLNGNGAR
jgi:glycosyltransferase involved in cell wall biosynthesis